MNTVPEGWKEYYSPRAQAPYYVNGSTGATIWERPDEPGAKRARVEGLDGSSSGTSSSDTDKAAFEQALQDTRMQHAAEVAMLKAKVLELSATGSVAAGHHAQHGHVAFTTSEEPLPQQPTIIAQHDLFREKEVKWTRSDLLVNEVGAYRPLSHFGCRPKAIVVVSQFSGFDRWLDFSPYSSVLIV